MDGQDREYIRAAERLSKSVSYSIELQGIELTPDDLDHLTTVIDQGLERLNSQIADYLLGRGPLDSDLLIRTRENFESFANQYRAAFNDPESYYATGGFSPHTRELAAGLRDCIWWPFCAPEDDSTL